MALETNPHLSKLHSMVRNTKRIDLPSSSVTGASYREDRADFFIKQKGRIPDNPKLDFTLCSSPVNDLENIVRVAQISIAHANSGKEGILYYKNDHLWAFRTQNYHLVFYQDENDKNKLYLYRLFTDHSQYNNFLKFWDADFASLEDNDIKQFYLNYKIENITI